MRVVNQKKIGDYYKIYEQIYENPLITLYDIAVNTGLCRNTVSKYVKEMYERGVIHGPHVCMKPARTYKEYVYLLNFTDPLTTFDVLERFPEVVYKKLTFGDWNILVISNELLDFSKMEGFENVVYQGMKYWSYTPKVDYMPWDQSFEEIYKYLDRFIPYRLERKKREVTFLKWGKDEWTLYHSFHFMREKVSPVLKKARVRYTTYKNWKKTLDKYCTVHTGFYPEGYKHYLSCCFLFDTDFEESVKFIFSLFPVSTLTTELDNYLLVFAHVIPPQIERNLICLVYDMETKRMIKGFKRAILYKETPQYCTI